MQIPTFSIMRQMRWMVFSSCSVMTASDTCNGQAGEVFHDRLDCSFGSEAKAVSLRVFSD